MNIRPPLLLTLFACTVGVIRFLPDGAPPERAKEPVPSAATASPAPAFFPTSKNETVRDPSLEHVFSRVRREVRALTGAESLIATNDGALYFAFHPGQNLAARFHADGALIRNSLGGPDLKISRLDAGSARVSAEGSRANYQRADGSMEWFDNADGGFEHGMTLPSRPEAAAQELRIGFSTAGMRAAEDPQHPGDLVFNDAAGKPVYGYRNLRAWDANGRDLPGTLAVSDGGFAWVIDDRAATYPVTIDPLVVNLDGTLQSATANGLSSFASGQVALDGDRAVVSAASETTPSGASAGTVYVFHKITGSWSLETRLESFDPQANEYFGHKIAIDGEWLAVIARFDNNPLPGGSVQLFHLSGATWFFSNRLQSGTNLTGAESMALKGSTLVVGLPGKTNFVSVQTGAVLVASRDPGGWNPLMEFYASDGLAGDSFGRSVATDGTRVVVGAPGRDSGGKSGSGAVYVFQVFGSFLSQQVTLVAADGQANDSLGASVATDAGRVVAGAPDQQRGTRLDGAAYVFSSTGGTWSQEAKLFAPVSTGGHISLGASVAMSGNRLAVSTQYFKAFGGQVLVYERVSRTWIRRVSLATDAEDYRFSTLAMAGSRLLAGFPLHSGNGAALVYELGNSSPAQEIAVFTGPETALQETQSGAPVSFGDAYLNESQAWPVTIFNDGTATLEVTGATLLAGASTGLTVDPIGSPLPGSLFISPGETAQVILRTQFIGGGPKSGTLRLASNDASEPNFDLPVTFQAVLRPAPLGLTITLQNGQAVLRYPHLQFFNYSVQRSTNLTNWITIGSMQTEFDPNTSTNIKVFRDFSPPPGKAFYKVTVD
jgi:hypothetical protein